MEYMNSRKETHAYVLKMSFITTDTAATAKGIVVAAAAVTAVRSERILPRDMLASEGTRSSVIGARPDRSEESRLQR